MPRKKKNSKEVLNENIEIDGKIASNKPTALEQIWGSDGLSKYGTMDMDVYTAKLDDMLPVDLQNHARDIGLRPDAEPHVLRERLMNEFLRHIASFKSGQVQVTASSPSSVPKNIHKILREGA
jgi:hypothetical protein